MPYPPAVWRLLLSPAADGPTNMAVDEAVLQAVALEAAPPTLRFFRWAPPCLSLGYAQPLGDADPARLRERGWDVVRRPTGGRAILHTDELTYSVIAPMDEPRVRCGVLESYRQLSAGLLHGLGLLGLRVQADQEHLPGSAAEPRGPVCFEVPSSYEITAGERKLLGSAQVRKRGVVLQHGTLPLAGDIARICEALHFASEADREAARQRVRRRATTVSDVLAQAVGWEQAAAAMRRGFMEALNLQLEDSGLTSAEQAATVSLREEKYAAEAWTGRL